MAWLPRRAASCSSTRRRWRWIRRAPSPVSASSSSSCRSPRAHHNRHVANHNQSDHVTRGTVCRFAAPSSSRPRPPASFPRDAQHLSASGTPPPAGQGPAAAAILLLVANTRDEHQMAPPPAAARALTSLMLRGALRSPASGQRAAPRQQRIGLRTLRASTVRRRARAHPHGPRRRQLAVLQREPRRARKWRAQRGRRCRQNALCASFHPQTAVAGRGNRDRLPGSRHACARPPHHRRSRRSGAAAQCGHAHDSAPHAAPLRSPGRAAARAHQHHRAAARWLPARASSHTPRAAC